MSTQLTSTQLTSAVDFATDSRVHMGLGVTDMDAATRFYTALFGAGPTKVRDGYARFEPESPPVNLSLNLGMSPGSFGGHFGVQVKEQAGIQGIGDRLKAAGFGLRAEEGVTCCWAVSEKIWANDPDGHAWEVFMTVDDHAPVHSAGKLEGCCSGAPAKEQSSPCCG